MKLQTSGALAALLLMAAQPAYAVTEAECVQTFEKADTDKNGTLSEAEASRYYATIQTANKPAATGDLTKDAFVSNCKAGMYTTADNTAANTTADTAANAPVAGANSFTEGQAKSRIAAAGYTDVSKLSKDDKGIWRGTAMQSGNKVNVAVDYQGNVVAN
jgi:hypothetical protein